MAEGSARELVTATTEAARGLSSSALTDRLRIPPADRHRWLPNDDLLAAQFANGVFTIFWRVAIAGACYPIVLSGVFFVAAIVSAFISPSNRDSFDIVERVFFNCTLGALVGFFWASAVSMAVAPLVYAVTRSLRLKGNVVWLAAFSGGLVGYIAVLPMLVGWVMDARHWFWEAAIVLMLGPGLTTVMGQVGGALGGRSVKEHQRVTGITVLSIGDGSRGAGRFQFGVWHLLVVSIWASILLTLIRLLGIDFLSAMLLLVGWAVFQAATLWVGGLLAILIGPWWARRKSRST